MAYNLTLTNGTNLVTVADGTTDTSATSLTLVGKNFAGYGQFLNENYVAMLENFSNPTPPANALQGQLWWNSTAKILQVLNGTNWKTVSSTTSSTNAPANPGTGDLWWDTANGQLKVYSGSTWVVIGPAYTATQGQTGAVASVVTEVGGAQSHIIVQFYVNNTVVAVMSKDPAFTVANLSGFTVINPGMTLSSTGGLKYYGDADNANNLGNQPASSYLRNDIAGTMQGNLSIKAGSGLFIGGLNDFNLSVTANSIVQSTSVNNKDMVFDTMLNSVQTPMVTLNAQPGAAFGTVTVNSDPVVAMGVATKNYVDNLLGHTGTGIFSGSMVTTTSTLQTTIAAVDKTLYRSVAFTVQAVNTADSIYHTCTILAIHDGITASSVEYGSIDIGGQSAVFSAAIVNNQVCLLATPNSSNSTVFRVTIYATLI